MKTESCTDLVNKAGGVEVLDDAIINFWVIICMDYYFYYQKNNMTKLQVEKFFNIREELQKQYKGVYFNLKFENYIECLKRNKLWPLHYHFDYYKEPKQRLQVMNDFMRRVYPVKGIFIQNDKADEVLNLFDKIYKSCELENIFEPKNGIKNYKDLTAKLRKKMLYEDKLNKLLASK